MAVPEQFIAGEGTFISRIVLIMRNSGLLVILGKRPYQRSPLELRFRE